jgi:polyisoprenoid-binding protein YceI
MCGNHGRAAVMKRTSICQPLREGGEIRPLNNPARPARANIYTRAGARMLLALLCLGVLLQLWAVDAHAQRAIDTEHSVLTVRVYKAGLLSAFGHEHEIRAPIREGSFDEEKSTVEFTVDAATLRVVDPETSDKDRIEIQSTMQGPKVLDIAKFREIRFHSTDVSRAGENRWIMHGELTLHGQTRPVRVNVEHLNGRYRGSADLRQKEFGITPVTVAGGSIKVKDEIRVEFDIVGK